MNGINQHQENTGLTQPSSYMADMIVEQLDKDGTVKKKYDIRGTWPSALGEIAVDYSQENVIEEFTVELQVQYWESNKTT
jgi:Rod binding domain-containing protein